MMFSKNRKVTAAVMYFVITLLVAWDVIAFFTGPKNDTESYLILEFASSHFTLPFIMSLLLGHFFWPRDEPPFGLSRGQSFFIVGVPVVLTMGIVDIFVNTPGWMLPLVAPVGYVFGSYFWPQRKIK